MTFAVYDLATRLRFFPLMNLNKRRLPMFLVVLLVVGVIVLSLADWRRAGRREVRSVPGVADLMLNAAERKLLMEQAAAGDATAAYRLGLHYHLGELNYAEGEAWMSQAAALGHVEAQKFMAHQDDQRRMHQLHLEAERAR